MQNLELLIFEMVSKNYMENEKQPPEKTVGEMHKQRETMPDGVRYIIFYTFGETEKPKGEEKKNV